MHIFVCLCIGLSLMEEVNCSCPSQCTCHDYNRHDDSGSRSVLCNDLDMNEVPMNIPVDTVKLHIEKTVIHRIPAEAFYYLVELQYLWVSCNSVTSIDPRSFYNLKHLHELRLSGNSLSAFPWASLLELPYLRTLDLHNNRITSVPAEATRYLKNLTYLDLSSNRLTTLPPDFLESWSHYSGETTSRSLDLALRRIILVIQESPGEGIRWSIISLTDISYKDAGDYKCKAKNSAGMSEAVVTVKVIGVVPTTTSSETSERRTGDHPEQEIKSGSGRSVSIRSSLSSLWPSSSLSSSLVPSISLSTSTLSPPFSSFSVSPLISSIGSWATTPNTSISASATMASRHSLPHHPEGKRNLKVEISGGSKFSPDSASKQEKAALLDTAMPTETNATIGNLTVLGQTEDSVTLMWDTINTTRSSAVTVLYSKYGEKDLLLLNADSDKNQVTIESLEPGRQYIACVCLKGGLPQKDQCITFSMDRVEDDDDFQETFLIVLGSIACIVVLLLICFLLYKVFTLQWKSDFLREDDLTKETYIQFETLSPWSQSVGVLWTQSYKEDSEKLLLCSRASVESQTILD
ncbi:PREDICTED: leucine-rich repeat, immunoglobulin-like domain and transmembrane domain-containing protein 3 [Chrysochloris asiatica]|uniref:leucine-rich repeat, immunoglobulin-like domain and transmembrane domain-containing protein 3 n=1 Tax=Chrysochloris asiatica TaxID=185453 RepID=UPI0003F14588|nr:PREDICTED: leucine-rich repeat, immunoglobulin-like domain and transmembrane domain-containing protein 3 [Chrysochloris asiatica]